MILTIPLPKIKPKTEVRFASVMKQFPAEAEGLFNACEEMAKRRYQSYVRMTKMDWSNE